MEECDVAKGRWRMMMLTMRRCRVTMSRMMNRRMMMLRRRKSVMLRRLMRRRSTDTKTALSISRKPAQSKCP